MQLVLLVVISEALWVGLWNRKVGHFKKGVVALVMSWGLAGVKVLPLVLPMANAMQASVGRSNPVYIWNYFAHYVDVKDFLLAQVGRFQPSVIFNASSMLFFLGPAPIAIWLWVLTRKSEGGNKKPTKILAIVAGIWWLSSTLLYGVLYWIPVVNRFRWPFKHLEMVAMEMAYATALGKPVFALSDKTGDPCRDAMIDRVVSTMDELVGLLK